MSERIEMDLGGKRLVIETGRVAKQADGAVLVQYGDTVVLVTVVASGKPRSGIDYLPLYVDYRERTYAAGEIPGGFFKREGRPNEKEIVTSRRMDRPIRPLFPEGLRHEIQVMGVVLSADKENDPDIPAVIGTGAALALSSIPFPTILSAVRVGRVDGEFVINPTHEQRDRGDLDLVIAGTRDAVTMVEGVGEEIEEQVFLDAIECGRKAIGQVVEQVEALASKAGRPKQELPVKSPDQALEREVEEFASESVRGFLGITDKAERKASRDAVVEKVLANFLAVHGEERQREVADALHRIEAAGVRRMVAEEGRRADGRKPDEIRQITCEVGVLPRTHGSALFTRGETQALAVTTLGTADDQQRVEELKGRSVKTFMLHYNFPPFSVGEVKPLRGPGRREIGHGVLAENALSFVLPKGDAFPYTIRLVSDILESNGSSSMATVCGGSLSLMDAGVPVSAAVAGVSIGMVTEIGKTVILSDIAGLEDHIGDMDLKIAGTRKGMTAIQMDIKVSGVTQDVLAAAVEQSRNGRMQILDKMEASLPVPRSELSNYAPRIISTMIPPDKVGLVIGPGGKTIRALEEKTGAEINIDDEVPGRVTIASVDLSCAQKALEAIESLVADVEVGQVYTGRVKKVLNFGAFVEVKPGKEGLVHISLLDVKRVENVEDVAKVGDEMTVKVVEIDSQGRINLSRAALLPGGTDDPPRRPPSRNRSDGGPSSRDRRPGGGKDRG